MAVGLSLVCSENVQVWYCVMRGEGSELGERRRFIEQADIDELSDEMHALIEKYWPWLLEDVRPRATH